MILQDVRLIIDEVLRATGLNEVSYSIEFTDQTYGDVATNVALKAAGQVKHSPRQLAQQIVDGLYAVTKDSIERASVAGPGFINIKLKDSYLTEASDIKKALKSVSIYKNQEIVVEYSDPNPFKALHAGHLYTTLVGDVVARLFEVAGGRVKRVNFGGDVGPHVARAMWGIIKRGSNGSMNEQEALEYSLSWEGRSLDERAEEVASCYVEATAASEADQEVQKAINSINKRVYDLHGKEDHTSDFARIYWLWRGWSYDYFKQFYKQINVIAFDKFYPESQTAALGMQAVQEHLKDGVFEESDGAVVFRGDKFGLHTRVFINSQGLPTYETKDLGLNLAKWDDYTFDRSVIITGNEITAYMKVVFKALEQFMPELPTLSTHISHGMVKLEGGKKMSSRKGNVLLASDILEAAKAAANSFEYDTDAEKLGVDAVKYTFAKQRIGRDIIYKPSESVALHGNSATYLHYSHARACSILAKANNELGRADRLLIDLEDHEHSLLVLISQYADVLNEACEDIAPHSICNYLFELAQHFNSFYEKNIIIDHQRQVQRLSLTMLFKSTMQHGLSLLGIQALESM